MAMEKKDEKGWKEKLTPEQFSVLREGATEPPFSGTYVNFKGEGTYVCAACGNELFRSEHKFDSGTGWPSFWATASEGSVKTKHRMLAGTEVTCAKCDGHLGHVFKDGPKPTGLRYCINFIALAFREKGK